MALQDDSQTGLAKAVRKAGGQAPFGRLIGRRQSTVFQWLFDGKELPAELVRQVEAALGIPRHELRPDLYPPEEAPFGVAHQPPAQHSAAQPSASVVTPPLSTTGVDGSSPAAGIDPLEGMAA